MTVLREEVAVERKLKALKEEIPRLPDLEAQFESKQAETRREIARLKRELSVTRERLSNVHVELSQTRYGLSVLENKSPKPVVTVTLTTPDSSFVVRDDDPAASVAWQRFFENVVEFNPDLEGRVNGSN